MEQRDLHPSINRHRHSTPRSLSCPRLNSYYWQCKENKSIPPGAVTTAPPKPQRKVIPGVRNLEGWEQCGGIFGHPDHADAPWPNAVCPDEYECVRQDE